jgi:hypothetical protein
MVILEFKLKGQQRQYAALDEAIRTTQFIRNKCVRLWQDTWGTTLADLNKYCHVLAHCPQCGLALGRDHNSARIILNKGLACSKHYRRTVRKVTLGESGASTCYGRPW